MTRCNIFVLFAAVAFLSRPGLAAPLVPKDTASLQREIDDAYRSGQKKVVIAPGVYPMDDRLRINDLADFEIDATGVTFARA